jgi:V-type H+-transporting ATPase subunit G
MAESKTNQDGFKMLRAAEKNATALVSKARAERSKRLADAKAEAAKELEAFRKLKQAEYEKISQERLGGSEETIRQQMAKQTDAEISKLTSQFNSNSGKVIDVLTDLVTKVTYEVPRSIRTGGLQIE